MSVKKSDAVVPAQLPGRNDPCHCGSKKKYKKCCAVKDEAKQSAQLGKEWEKAEKEFEKQKKEAEKNQAEGGAAAPTQPGHKPQAGSDSPHVQKHSTMTVPKFNMPRKTGGG